MSAPVNPQTLASLAATLQACQQALASMQQSDDGNSNNTNAQANTIATGVSSSPSTDQAPIASVDSPAISLNNVPVTTVPILANVLTNAPVSNVPFIGSPVTTTPIIGNNTNTVNPYSNDDFTATNVVGNSANVTAVTDCPVTVVSFADSPVTTNVASAEVAAFLTAITSLIQQNAVKVDGSNSNSQPSQPKPTPKPQQTSQADQVAVDPKTAQVLNQLQALGFKNMKRNLILLQHFKGDYFQTLQQLIAERQANSH